jgi:uncharacterized protein
MMSAETPVSHEDAIRAWQKHRNEGLRSEKGWLTLVGLFWLKPGDNSIGSAENSDMRLPKTAAEKVGILRVDGTKVMFIEPEGKEKQLSYDEDKPDVIRSNSVSFYVIKRGERLGVRAKDSESPVRKSFAGTSFFPINAAMRFEARMIDEPKKVPILNVLGQTDMEESPGLVEFNHKGQSYRLRALYEDTANGKTLYFLFKDLTSKTSTYQAGRMLNVPLPVNGKVDLDFNRAYNPPCTFTIYATCPIAPAENHLPIAIEAGEKRYNNGHPVESN